MPCGQAEATQPQSAEGATLRHLGERAVHALRALDREVAKRPGQVDLSYLLHNGTGGGRTSGVVWVDRKVRRRIAAVVRFHPVAALRADAAEAVGRSCPQSAQARTYAAYLLQFLRDRPEAYAVEPAGAWAESGEVWRVRTRCGELRQQGPWLLLPIPGAHPSSRQGRAA